MAANAELVIRTVAIAPRSALSFDTRARFTVNPLKKFSFRFVTYEDECARLMPISCPVEAVGKRLRLKRH